MKEGARYLELQQRLGLPHQVFRFLPRTVQPLEPAPGSVDALLVALGAILAHHGFAGPAMQEIIKRARRQLESHADTIRVDFRDRFPIEVRIPVAELYRRLQ